MVRQFIVRAGSSQLKRLEQLAADSHKTSSSVLPPEYYADQWRLTAAQYYYERELRREQATAAAGGKRPATVIGATEMTLNPKPPAIAPANFALFSEQSAAPAEFGSSYWQREIDRARARQQTLLANLPAPVSMQRPVIATGEWIAGRPDGSWAAAAVTAAALSALGMWWLQNVNLRGSGSGDCQPRMQLHLPADWVRQSPPLGQRLIGSIVIASWMSILAHFAANLP